MHFWHKFTTYSCIDFILKNVFNIDMLLKIGTFVPVKLLKNPLATLRNFDLITITH